MRVVFDANILVSALISGQGKPAQIINRWRQGEFELAVSLPILEEIRRVVHYPRIQNKYKLPEDDITKFLQQISSAAIIVNPTASLTIVEKDPSDNRYIECAIEAGAMYIVTGDAHLLNLKEYKGIFILTAAGFLTVLKLSKSEK
jgi:uncharacterized protein